MGDGGQEDGGWGLGEVGGWGWAGGGGTRRALTARGKGGAGFGGGSSGARGAGVADAEGLQGVTGDDRGLDGRKWQGMTGRGIPLGRADGGGGG